jgi:hypothetical protein
MLRASLEPNSLAAHPLEGSPSPAVVSDNKGSGRDGTAGTTPEPT